MTSDNGTAIPFEEAYELGEFEFKKSNSGVQCNAPAFKAQDFAPGIQKHCFCDADGVHNIN